MSGSAAMVQLGNLGWMIFVAAAAGSFGLLLLLRPLLQRYALVRPNVRSSHRMPTPQGGGIAVIGATTLVLIIAAMFVPSAFDEPFQLAIVFLCVVGIAVVGATDDIRPLEALPRMLLQALAVSVVLAALPSEFHIFSFLPWVAERALLFVGMIWFVNLVNFMDGIDWMTVAEVVPVTAALALFGLMGALPHHATFAAFALCGAMIGFAPFNRPVAGLFLGDVGSLPVGLLLGWLLILLAGGGHLIAALLLPLYYLADATITLMHRLIKREQILQAHRSHFYQLAIDGGFSVYQVTGRVFGLNVILTGLAILTTLNASPILHMMLLAVGSVLVGLLLLNFKRGHRN
jgi:UDP-N-acetylmuramyl pentapeptide phosphotransferase/UDP-N-acetylglucosamine-1-phosphate transferase